MSRRRGSPDSFSVVRGAASLLTPGSGTAFEFFDGRLQVHGYVATQIRTLGKDLSVDEQWDLSQWYNIVNLELEATPFPKGLGKLEILTFYVRAEARYDCVWTRACGMFPSVNTYGNRAEQLPNRLIDGDAAGRTGSLANSDSRLASDVDRDNFQLANRFDRQDEHHSPLKMSQLPGFVSLFGNGDGPKMVFEEISGHIGDDPPSYYFASILKRCKFGVKNSRGGENGQVWDILGPWNPGCDIEENGSLRHKPNPLSIEEFIPVLAGIDRIAYTGDECNDPRYATPATVGCPGASGFPKIYPYGEGALPYRPAPFHLSTEGGVPKTEAQGLYLPSAGLVRELKSGRLDSIDQNFSQAELEWNRGASQQDEKELKEAYADIEMFEGRLWLRLGLQTIVWGKTELFRNTDQFNPQDFAMASIPALEESRIGLWAARGTWSFYNIGKFEDVRLEVAMNLDDAQPADLGRCGEPYAVELVCNISFGYFAHGFAGAGLAGQDLAPNPWNDASGLEVGARLEWRYGRFSYQLSDFYGYDDFPHPRRISTYERNVDPNTGRIRRAGNLRPLHQRLRARLSRQSQRDAAFGERGSASRRRHRRRRRARCDRRSRRRVVADRRRGGRSEPSGRRTRQSPGQPDQLRAREHPLRRRREQRRSPRLRLRRVQRSQRPGTDGEHDRTRRIGARGRQREQRRTLRVQQRIPLHAAHRQRRDEEHQLSDGPAQHVRPAQRRPERLRQPADQ